MATMSTPSVIVYRNAEILKQPSIMCHLEAETVAKAVTAFSIPHVVALFVVTAFTPRFGDMTRT